MASNNYLNANITPSSDTFREWVDLTNRITFDMEKFVVSTVANTQGACTTGNSYVNGFFSANSLLVEQKLSGVTANSTVYGTKAAAANLIISSNVVFIANSTANAIIHAQSNAHFAPGVQLTTNSTSNNLTINSTAKVFESNAVTNIFNTKIDANANLDIDNALTQITSTNTVVENGELNITSNVNFDAASFDVLAGALNVTQSNSTTHKINIDPTANIFTSNAGLNVFNTPLDINANADFNNALTNFSSTNTAINGGEFNVSSNVNIDAAVIDINAGVLKANSTAVEMDATAVTFTSNATTNIFNTKIDANANLDVDNALTDITSTDFIVSGTNTLIGSTNMNIHGTSLDINSNTNIDGILTTTANATIGNANSDLLTVTANAVFSDKIKVTKDADFDASVNIDTDLVVQGNTDLGSAASDTISVVGVVDTNIIPSANGSKSLGSVAARWDVVADDLVGEDITSNNDLTITRNATVGGNVSVNAQFTIANSTVNTLVTSLAGNTRTITLGNAGAANATHGFDRLIVKGLVGNSTQGLIPLHGNNVVLGDTNHRWHNASFTNANTSGTLTSTGVITASANIEAAATTNTNVLKVTTTSTHTGHATFGDGIAVTGTSNTTVAYNVGANVNLSTSKLSVGNSTVNTSLTSTAVHTDGTLTVLKATDLANTLDVTGATTLSGSANIVGVTTLSNDLDIADNKEANVYNAVVRNDLTVSSNAALGTDINDVITIEGSINRLRPTANGQLLGGSLRRWAAALTTVNTSGDITAGADVDITGEVNAASGAIVGDLSVGDDITLANTSNVIFSNTGISANATALTSNNLVVDHLQVGVSAQFPSDTTLTATELGSANVTVTNSLKLTGASTTGAGNNLVQIGNGANTVQLVFANASVNGHVFASNTNQWDIGSAAKSFKNGYFDTSIVVGDTLANTTAVLANNIYATDDLVASYSSDQQLKDNILKIDTALDKVNALGGYEFVWNNNIGDMRVGTPDYGVIAQELENVLPHAVDINSRGFKTVNYNALIPLLIEAVKELTERVKELEPNVEENEEEDV